MVVIYHSQDLDGYCSGAICKLAYPDARLIGYNYNEPFPVELEELDDIIMVDVSIPIDFMNVYAERCHANGKSFTWIDHHISVIADYNKLRDEVPTFMIPVLDHTISACEGAWKYLFPDKRMPMAVYLLGRYDSWREPNTEEWDKMVMPFQYGMRHLCNSPENFPTWLLFATDQSKAISNIMENGDLILNYQQMQNERMMKYAFETTFAGYRALCVNTGGGNSQMFKSKFDPEKHDIMIPFFYSGHGWTFSLFTTKDDIDCSVIAKSLGGGGHKKAAGFKQVELPEAFKLTKPVV